MSNYEEELFTGLASFNFFSFNAGPLGKLTYPYICCMFCWALDTVLPLRRTMKPSLIHLEWVNRNWKKENLFGWMLPLWCLSCQARTADGHTHTRTSDSLTNTHKHQSNSLTDFIFSYFTCIVFAGSEWHILPTTFVH